MCGYVDEVSDTTTCRPILPKPVLKRVDASVGTVLDKIIKANIIDAKLSLEIEIALRRASQNADLHKMS